MLFSSDIACGKEELFISMVTGKVKNEKKKENYSI